MSATNLQAVIRSLAESLLERDDLFVVDVQVRGLAGGTQKVLVLADGDKGIGIDDISALSRALGAAMEEQNLISGAYTLEVSSPGVDHPLESPRSFAKNIGRLLRVERHNGHVDESPLVGADGEGISLEPPLQKKKHNPKPGEPPTPEPGPIQIPYADIKKAVVLIRF